MPSAEFESAFTTLKSVFAKHRRRLVVKADTPGDYTLVGKVPSPFPQHKGQPLFVGAVRMGKAYVTLHLVPLYMNRALAKTVSPGLKKRMRKGCFNFKKPPEKEQLAELKRLTDAGVKLWAADKWV